MTLIRSSNATISNRLTRYVSLPVLRAIYGVGLSVFSPLGWVFLQYIAGRDPLAPENVDGLLYTYMALATAIVFAALGYAIGRREQMITDLALTDGLTALYNKRYFKNRIEQEFVRHQRLGSPMAIIQVDLDYFKQVNDTWGHQAGDEVLKSVANTILANCRKNEIAARVGGEEISIIASDSGESDAAALAERLRAAIEEMIIHWQGETIHVTSSFGIAEASADSENAWAVYQQADLALYEAKRRGRNRICSYSSMQPAPVQDAIA